MTGTLPSNCLVSYPGHALLGGKGGGLTPLQRCSVFYSPSRLGNVSIGAKPAFTIQVLVVGGDLQGFDWLLGLDAIKQLGVVSVTRAGEDVFAM